MLEELLKYSHRLNARERYSAFEHILEVNTKRNVSSMIYTSYTANLSQSDQYLFELARKKINKSIPEEEIELLLTVAEVHLD